MTYVHRKQILNKTKIVKQLLVFENLYSHKKTRKKNPIFMDSKLSNKCSYNDYLIFDCLLNFFPARILKSFDNRQ